MCEYSGRLVAWLDHELPDVEATNVEWHLKQCEECWQAAARYEEISGAFLDCYQATIAAARPAAKSKRRVWPLAVGLSAAAAILIAIFVRPPRVEQLAPRAPQPAPAPAIAFVRSSMPKPTVRVRRVVAPKSVSDAPVLATQPAFRPALPVVRVALPADALFPPGAVPEGFSFIADVRPQP